MYNTLASVFLLEFKSEDSNRIAEAPVQFLSDGDNAATIKVCQLDEYCSNRLYLSCDYAMNGRLIRKVFSKFGLLRSLNPCGYGNFQWILAFEDEEAAKGATAIHSMEIAPLVIAVVKKLRHILIACNEGEWTDIAVDAASTRSTSTSMSLKFDLEPEVTAHEESNRNLQNHAKKDLGNTFTQSVEALTLETESRQRSNFKVVDSNLTLASLLSSSECDQTGSSNEASGLEAENINHPASFTKENKTPKPLHHPGIDLRGCMKVKNCIIRILRGDLTKHSAEAIVSSHKGMVNNMIRHKTSAGKVWNIKLLKGFYNPEESRGENWLEYIWKENSIRSCDFGRQNRKLLITSSERMASKYLFALHFHTLLTDRDFVTAHTEMIQLYLAQCDSLAAKSIAFPALGTGEYGKPPPSMAKLLIEATLEYFKAAPTSTIELVDIVIYHHEVVPYYIHQLNIASQEPSTRR